MEEKYLVSLQEIKFAIESEGGMDIGDFNYDTLVDILELIDNQQKEIEEKNMTINKMAKDISIQLKEIEELKKDNNHQWEERCRLAIETDRLNEEKEQYKTMGTNAFVNAFVESNYISKDKIKAKIQELEEEMKELLEE